MPTDVSQKRIYLFIYLFIHMINNDYVLKKSLEPTGYSFVVSKQNKTRWRIG